MREIDKIIIHCSDSEFGNVERIREWHTSAPRRWSDIGYHYVICNGIVNKGDEVGDKVENGAIEVGRPIERTGAHAYGHNNSSIGICLIGIDSFTDKQFESLKHLVNGLMENYDIMPNKVLGHYQVDKHGKTCPNFDVPKFVKTIGE